MGNFYSNFTVRGSTPEAVAAALTGRSALVTPLHNNSIVVFDEECESQNLSTIAEVGARLSTDLSCTVLAVMNHDDDILFYTLYEQGSQRDEYCSAPGYFSGEDSGPSGGDAKKLCAAFGSGDPEALAAVLHPDANERPAFAVEQHAALVAALDVSNYAVGLGFNYASAGDLPGALTEADLIRVG